MKKIAIVILSCILALTMIGAVACGGGGKADKVQIFERIVAEQTISKYITEGTEGLVSQYDRIEYYYAGSASKAYKTFYNIVMVYETEAQATSRFNALKSTYGDDVKLMGRGVYVNHTDETAVDKSKSELESELTAKGYVLVPEKEEESK